METTKQTGTVRRWMHGTYGFIERDDNGEGLFVHERDIQMQGFRQLRPGQRVRFDLGATERGPKAVAVEIID